MRSPTKLTKYRGSNGELAKCLQPTYFQRLMLIGPLPRQARRIEPRFVPALDAYLHGRLEAIGIVEAADRQVDIAAAVDIFEAQRRDASGTESALRQRRRSVIVGLAQPLQVGACDIHERRRHPAGRALAQT